MDFLSYYDFNTPSGLSWMTLAEALLRIPDSYTADALIADRLGRFGFLTKTKLTTPIAKCAIKIMAKQFVMAETIEQALAKSNNQLYSFDMLGESAVTQAQALKYLDSYTHAIHMVGKASQQKGPIHSSGISIKLSALYPRYEILKQSSGFPILYERLKTLALLAKSYDIGMTIDAEECDRLEYQLALFGELMQDKDLADWTGLGIAVQAYQKRAESVIHLLAQWTEKYQRHIMVRLVKGAYWDTEIKRVQVLGLDHYPVFTKKAETDASYLHCANLLYEHREYIYSQFGTHNLDTLRSLPPLKGAAEHSLSIPPLEKGVPSILKARICYIAPSTPGVVSPPHFEIQRLFGMGKKEHDTFTKNQNQHILSRIYAPIGSEKDLLAYLIRRLLENGANTSFLKQTRHHLTPPIPKHIPLPKSQGEDVTDLTTLKEIQAAVQSYAAKMPFTTIKKASSESVSTAFDAAYQAFATWSKLPIEKRAKIIKHAGELLREKRYLFYTLLIKEAGKTLSNAIGEVREAVDYCEYYSDQALKLMSQPIILPGPTGELNQMSYRARGVIACISPWNFPLAIFAGQIIAALVVGNTVIAKPANQTSQIASEMVTLLHEAGVPQDVLQLLIGPSSSIGNAIIDDPHLAGVIFTGSSETAQRINQSLAKKSGPIVPFIAETSGLNTAIIDSSALLEQSVMNVIQSAFDSAGQRCSALRILFLQNDIADQFITLLKGAMDMLTVGDPMDINVDIGPVIDKDAQKTLNQYIDELKSGKAKWVYQPPARHCEERSDVAIHHYVFPTVCEIDSLEQLKGEVFGPVLHIVRYAAQDLDKVIQAINDTGYGLTFGIESRIEGRYKAVTDKIEAGNAYVNRNIIGAMVGVQPFGGQGLSGTGPKAGGPNYLLRLVHERVLTINTAAIGGDISLLT